LETKLERTKSYSRNVLVCTLLIALAFSAAATSMANATIDDNTPSMLTQAPTGDSAAAPNENPNLIAAEDNSTLTVAPASDRSSENSTLPQGDSSSLYISEDAQLGDNAPLIATQTQPDNPLVILGVIALLAAIAVCAAFVVFRYRKKVSA
jgi:hypothetical protein